MGELPTSEGGADHGDAARASGDTATSISRHLRDKLRACDLASDTVAAGALACQDRYCGRVFEAEGFPIKQGDGTSERAGEYRTIYRALVELNWNAGTEWAAGSVGPDVVCRFRRAIEEELYRVLRGVPYGEPVHKEDCPAERRGGGDTGGGEGCFGCI